MLVGGTAPAKSETENALYSIGITVYRQDGPQKLNDGLASRSVQMFVTKTLTEVPVYKAFGTSRAAQRWAESGAYLEHNAERSEIYRTVSGLNSIQAIAAVKIGKAEHLLTVRRRGDDGASLIETTRH